MQSFPISFFLVTLALVLAVAPGCERAELLRSGSGRVAGWPTTGGDPGGTRYSPLDQIHRGNVQRLQVAWTAHTGHINQASDPSRVKKGTAFEATPILLGDSLYLCTPLNQVIALDARSGALRWIHDAKPNLENTWTPKCRGVAVWSDSQESAGPCARRVFMGTVDARLIAIDADTGKTCPDFGQRGEVDLLRGLGSVDPGEYSVTSPPAVVADVVAVGALVADNRRVLPPGGVIRGFDVRTGALRWAFDPIAPGTPPLSPDAEGEPRFHRGTPNAWSLLSADLERGLLFIPMGAPSPDFYGGLRVGIDYYANSVVALDARTGGVVWHFQTVHHDLWDYDVASQPSLIELETDSGSIPALVQPTKMGHVFVLDRRTGEPIFPVEERQVPTSDVPGEVTSPTQPFPTHPPPLHPARLDPDQAFGFTFWDRGRCREKIAALRNEGIFTPPSLQGSIVYPGTPGGFNWGSAAWDPERHLLILQQNHIAQKHQLIPREDVGSAKRKKGRGSTLLRMTGTPYVASQEVLVSPFGVPCVSPPWGSLLAVDLETGRVDWDVPLGDTREMAPLGIALDWGMPAMGGPIVTAGGLAFIAATMDDTFRAFDSETGELLWSAALPAGAQATPMTYQLDSDGRQFVVIAAGGHATLGTTPGDAVIAFSLPPDGQN